MEGLSVLQNLGLRFKDYSFNYMFNVQNCSGLVMGMYYNLMGIYYLPNKSGSGKKY